MGVAQLVFLMLCNQVLAGATGVLISASKPLSPAACFTGVTTATSATPADGILLLLLLARGVTSGKSASPTSLSTVGRSSSESESNPEPSNGVRRNPVKMHPPGRIMKRSDECCGMQHAQIQRKLKWQHMHP